MAKKKHGRNRSVSQATPDDTTQPSTPVQATQDSPNLSRGLETRASPASQEDPPLSGDPATRGPPENADAQNVTGQDSPSQPESSSQNQEVTPRASEATPSTTTTDSSAAGPSTDNHSTSAGQTSKSGDSTLGSAQVTDISGSKATLPDLSLATTEQDTQSTKSSRAKKVPTPLNTTRGESSFTSNAPQDKSLNGSKPTSSKLSTQSGSTGVKRASSIISDPNRPLPAIPTEPTNLRPHPPSSSAESTYETPLSTAAHTRSSTPTNKRLLVMHDTVKQTTTIDWYINLSLHSNGLPHAYETTTSLASGDEANGTVCWKTDITTPEDPISTITIDSPARLDIRVYSTVTTSSPIIDRYVDGSKEDTQKITILWQDLKRLVGSKNTLELLVSITITDAKEPLPSDALITETSSPASIEALGGFLDQPGGHDVVFQFPRRGNLLYADRYILQRSSAYFRSRLQLPGEEAVATTNGVSTSRKKLDEDSDDDLDGDEDEARAGVDSSAPNGAQSPIGKKGRDGLPTRSNTGISPASATHSKIEFCDTPAFRIEHLPQHPRNNIGVLVTQTKEVSYRTFRAVLYYMYTGYIAFAPITSNIPLTEDSDLSVKELQEKRRAARESMVKMYTRKYPNRPEPVSPKSVYMAARKYGLPALEAQALARIQIDMAPAVTIVELFSPFTRAHQSIRDYQLKKAVSVWAQILKTPEWAGVRKEAKEKPDSYFTEALFDILDHFAQGA